MEYSRIKGDNSGFLGILGLVFTLVTICIISYLAVKVYFKKPIIDAGMGEPLSVPVVTPSNYKAAMKSAISQVEDSNKQRFKVLDEMYETR